MGIVTVTLIRNVLTHLYLTQVLFGSLEFHGHQLHPSNLHLYDNGPHRNLQVFNDSRLKFIHKPTNGCQQNFELNSTGSEIHTVPQSSIGVKLYVLDANNTPYYFRVNAANHSRFELVCQEYVTNVTESGNPWLRQELEFDLVSVRVNEINENLHVWSSSTS